MNNTKTSDSFNKSNKTFGNKSLNKFGTNHDKKNFDNKIADVNLDLMRIN